jgi:hypothetical protein
MLFLVIISQNIEIQDLGLPMQQYTQSQHNYTAHLMIRNHSLDNIALIFWSTASVIGECMRLSRQQDSEFDVFTVRLRLHTNAKANKV